LLQPLIVLTWQPGNTVLSMFPQKQGLPEISLSLHLQWYAGMIMEIMGLLKPGKGKKRSNMSTGGGFTPSLPHPQ